MQKFRYTCAKVPPNMYIQVYIKKKVYLFFFSRNKCRTQVVHFVETCLQRFCEHFRACLCAWLKRWYSEQNVAGFRIVRTAVAVCFYGSVAHEWALHCGGYLTGGKRKVIACRVRFVTKQFWYFNRVLDGHLFQAHQVTIHAFAQNTLFVLLF